MSDGPQFSAEEKRREALREVAMREKVYGRMLAVDGMSREKYERQIAIMTEIAADYGELAKKERLL